MITKRSLSQDREQLKDQSSLKDSFGDQYFFELPDNLIALRPSNPRDDARMLVVTGRRGEARESLADHIIRDLPDFLAPGDVVVVNDTRVIPARLYGHRYRNNGQTSAIEIMLSEQQSSMLWRGLARSSRRLAVGDVVDFGALNGKIISKGLRGEVMVEFMGEPELFAQNLAACGRMPLPPYIVSRRTPDIRDVDDYQSCFASTSGAVAAPTASLHFTSQLCQKIIQVGIEIIPVTLHVGEGTFRPPDLELIKQNRLHSERGILSSAAANGINLARKKGGRVVAVGTTVARLLETAADSAGKLHPFCDLTSIFIQPGYCFRAIDMLLTNFHRPGSTLMMLVSAFSGLDLIHSAYHHGIVSGYRFYSYGDACLLCP